MSSLQRSGADPADQPTQAGSETSGNKTSHRSEASDSDFNHDNAKKIGCTNGRGDETRNAQTCCLQFSGTDFTTTHAAHAVVSGCRSVRRTRRQAAAHQINVHACSGTRTINATRRQLRQRGRRFVWWTTGHQPRYSTVGAFSAAHATWLRTCRRRLVWRRTAPR